MTFNPVGYVSISQNVFQNQLKNELVYFVHSVRSFDCKKNSGLVTRVIITEAYHYHY